jgi:hypothetical protein
MAYISDLSTQDLTVFDPQAWAAEMQKTYFKENVARAFVNESLATELTAGTRINRPYRKTLVGTDYTKGTSISSWNALGGTNEYLDVDQIKIVPSYVDDLDQLHNKWDMAMAAASDSQRALNNLIDQKILSRYSDAYSAITAQDLGGSGTGAYAVGSSNIKNLFTVADRQLNLYNRGLNNRFAVIGPRLLEQIKLDVSNRETAFGDKVYDNGLVGPRFGFDVYLSNNVPFTATITTSSIPVDGETFTIGGVVFTWEAHGTNCSSAGEVDIGTNEAEAYANLVLAINGTTAGTTSTYYDVSDDDREFLQMAGITASFDTHTLTISGYGDVPITETTTNCAVTTNIQYPIFGVKGAIDFVALKEPNVVFRPCENLLGRKIYAWTNYGVKTFTKEKKSLVYAKIDTSSWL